MAAVSQLRGGALATSWTGAEGDVPAVPVVGLRTWDELAEHRDAAVAELEGAAMTAV